MPDSSCTLARLIKLLAISCNTRARATRSSGDNEPLIISITVRFAESENSSVLEIMTS
ncbi:Uncharacterised protein [Vibrio cholerae]|nr:Uncharacterised protein [Vibrio cholerae]